MITRRGFKTINIYESKSIFFLLFILVLFTALVVMKTYGFTKKYTENVDEDVLKFEAYQKRFAKKYIKIEYPTRFHNFKDSLVEISRLNSASDSVVFGLTKFSDMSDEDKKSMLLKRNVGCSERVAPCTPRGHNCSLPEYILNKIDWRDKGVVKPVLEQKKCNGCWAFSVVGVIETMSAIRYNDFQSRSIQELIDCSTYTKGCLNGNVVQALDFICAHNLNLTTEVEYPLTLRTQGCQLNEGLRTSGRTVKGFCNHCNIDENVILRILSNHGPVAVVVNALPLFNYVGGIIQRACVRGATTFDHVLQIVGYDNTDDIPYYVMRNSWGRDYGENGYIRMAIGRNVCGLADEVTYLDVI